MIGQPEQPPILCRVLTGPTASGKSELGLRLAREMGWEILCMDSMQVYRRMDIGTAKPTPEERRLVPHHMLDLLEPAEPYSVAQYREAAEALVRSLDAQGKQVLFVGGTALYLQAMMHPLGMGQVPADPRLREELNRQAETPEGRRALHERLFQLDPDTARRLPVNDVRRVIRAIEVCEATGVPFSRQPPREENESSFRWRVVSTRMERQRLYGRINERVTDMIRHGLREEVAALLREGVPETAQSMQGLGYKEMVPCLQGACTLEEAADRIRLGTRHYAKRQMTFLRREAAVQYVDTETADAWDTVRRILTEE